MVGDKIICLPCLQQRSWTVNRRKKYSRPYRQWPRSRGWTLLIHPLSRCHLTRVDCAWASFHPWLHCKNILPPLTIWTPSSITITTAITTTITLIMVAKVVAWVVWYHCLIGRQWQTDTTTVIRHQPVVFRLRKPYSLAPRTCPCHRLSTVENIIHRPASTNLLKINDITWIVKSPVRRLDANSLCHNMLPIRRLVP